MAIERTLSIIKPDAVAKNVIGEIYTRFEQAGLKIVASKMMQLTDETAGGFYAEHQGKGFYGDLIEFMTSGPVVIQVLEGENAVLLNRELMGTTNPAEAAPVRFVPTLLNPLMPMRCMVLIPQLLRSGKSVISLRETKSARAAKRPENPETLR